MLSQDGRPSPQWGYYNNYKSPPRASEAADAMGKKALAVMRLLDRQRKNAPTQGHLPGYLNKTHYKGPVRSYREVQQGMHSPGKPGDLKKKRNKKKRRPRPTIGGQLNLGTNLSVLQQNNKEMEDLFSRLMDSVSSGSPNFDYQKMMRQNASKIRNTYSKEINAIRHNNVKARNQAEVSRNTLGNMYNALARSYAGQSKRARKQGRRNVKAAQRLGKQTSNTLSNAESNMIKQEAALLKKLGIERAAPDMLKRQGKELQQELGHASQRTQSNATLAQRLGQNQSRYMTRGKQNSKMEGTNRKADITGQLQAILANNQGQIAGLKGKRARDIMSSNQQLASQASQARSDYANTTWDRMMQLGKFKNDINQQRAEQQLNQLKFNEGSQMDQLNAQLAARKLNMQQSQNAFDQRLDIRKLRNEARLNNNKTQNSNNILNKSPLGVATNFLAKNSRSLKGKNSTINALQAILAQPKFQQHQIDIGGGRTRDLTPEAMMAEAQKYGKANGMSPQEIQNLRLALYLYGQG